MLTDSYGYTKDWVYIAAICTLVVIFIGGIVLLDIHDSKLRERCEDKGGSVEITGHSTTFITMSCGSGCSITQPVTTEQWRCYVPAEKL